MRRERFLPDEIVRRLKSAPAVYSRRDFVKVGAAAGGGLWMMVSLGGAGEAAPAHGSRDGLAHDGGSTFEPNVFVRVHPENTATITVRNSEMGQGVRTTLALMVAEELDLDWNRVKIEQAPNDPEKYGRQGTGGSASVHTAWTPLREAGAKARAMLVAAAAAELGVTEPELETRDSHVIHPASGRRLAYGELAAAASELPVPEQVQLKSPDRWRLLGREHVGVDVDDIVTGRATYGSDIRLPDMKYAVVARTPAHGGSVTAYDASRALEVPGVLKVVEVQGIAGSTHVHPGVAVVAENTWAALRGRDALEIEWDPGPGGGDTSEAYSAAMREAVSRPGAATVNRVGDPDGVIAAAEPGQVIEATFELPLLSHATMEPQNCVAEVDGDRCRLRAPTQFPNWAAPATADALDIPPENVQLTIPLLGGGFGRRINPDYAVEAALIAREVDGPVKVIWTREDDMRHDFYRPAAVHRIQAVLGPDGYPTAWRHRFSTPAISGTYEEVNEEEFGVSEATGAGDMLYRVPHRSCEYTYLPSRITRGWWRAVSTTHTTFAVEVFIDELAERAGMDPVEYRLALIDRPTVDRPRWPESAPAPLDHERLKGVLRLAAEKARWGEPLPEGHGMGVACGIDHLSYSAEAIEVSVKDGELRIERVVCAADCGPVLNPNGGRAQIEGAIIQGLSAALRERLTVRDGAIQQGNFDGYPILRMSEAPRAIEVHFAETDSHPTGLGEPGVPPAAPALANAIYRATGRRYRTLPISL